MFADNTFCLKSGHNLPELIREVNCEINKITVWFRANKLTVNIRKLNILYLRPEGKK
jgi:hypothetical protein